MSGLLIGSLILWLIIAIIVIVVFVYIVNWLYHRSSKEVAFVRTGFLGERVVIDGGAFVLPFIHDFTPVNMNVLPMAIVREKGDALITRDRMRIDIEADFYVRVRATREAVSIAAATLGRRTLEPERLHALLSGKFVSSLRSVASEMTMEQMHEQRGEYVSRVKAAAAEALAQNGLELEVGRDHRPGPDRSRILQSLQSFRRRGLDQSDGGDRVPAQIAQSHRTGIDDQYPHPQPRGGAAGAGNRARQRSGAARPAARYRSQARDAAHRGRARARAS